jgi:hypothetical protein
MPNLKDCRAPCCVASHVCCGCCEHAMQCRAQLTDIDLAENVLAPEFESALYAALRDAGPIKYNADGIKLLSDAANKVIADMGKAHMDALINKAIRTMLYGKED